MLVVRHAYRCRANSGWGKHKIQLQAKANEIDLPLISKSSMQALVAGAPLNDAPHLPRRRSARAAQTNSMPISWDIMSFQIPVFLPSFG
jgi:hypothetical protein